MRRSQAPRWFTRRALPVYSEGMHPSTHPAPGVQRFPHWMGASAITSRRWVYYGVLWGGAGVCSVLSLLAMDLRTGGAFVLPMLFVVVATLGSFAVMMFVAGGDLGHVMVTGEGLWLEPGGARLDVRYPVEREVLASRTVLRLMQAQAYGPARALGVSDQYAWVALRVRQGTTDLTFRAERVPTGIWLGAAPTLMERMPPGTRVLHVGQDALEALSRHVSAAPRA